MHANTFPYFSFPNPYDSHDDNIFRKTESAFKETLKKAQIDFSHL